MERRRSENPDAGSVFDKIAESREGIERVENDAAPTATSQQHAQNVEDRMPERQEGKSRRATTPMVGAIMLDPAA
jgi:hypothetical protein